MSLLLKALQKSEAERNQNPLALPATPGYQPGAYSGGYHAGAGGSQGNTIIHTGGNSSAWLAVVLGCNMMLVIAMAFFWFQWQQQSRTDNTDNLVLRALSRNFGDENTAPSLQPAEQSLAESLQSTVDAARQHLDLPSAKARAASPEPKPALIRLDSVARPEPPPVPATNTRKRNDSSAPALAEDKLYEMSELKPQQLAGFPALHYNAHLYSPDLPSARMFMANDTRYAENDRIDANTKVEAIVSEGVIFNFKGIRVKVNVVDKLQ